MSFARWVLFISLVCSAVPGVSKSQESIAWDQIQDKGMDELIKIIAQQVEKEGDYYWPLKRLRTLNNPAAIPGLEQAYRREAARSEEPIEAKPATFYGIAYSAQGAKLSREISRVIRLQSIASVLIRLGSKDEKYYKLLEKHAARALIRDIPYRATDPYEEGAVPEDFAEWCQKNGMDQESAGLHNHFDQTSVRLLAESRDARGRPLFLKGLWMKDLLAAAYAAEGLLGLGEPDSYTEIIAVCRKRPGKPAKRLARYLSGYDDPKALAAMEEFIKEEPSSDRRKRRNIDRDPKIMRGALLRED